jgi:dimethylglycine oxidase
VAEKVVIIGAGIVGCSIADELTERGVTDVTVLDQGPLPLTGGSTSHAPGLVFQTNVSKMHTDLARYTVEKLSSMPYGDSGETCFWSTGSIEIAITDERWAELHRRQGFAASWGVEGSILSADECRERWPQIGDDVDLKGGYLVPTDGVARAVWACEEMTRRAAARGATFHGSTEVTGFVRNGDGRVVGVETDGGRFDADLVVVAAGMWGPKLGRLLGVSVPLVPLQHLFAWTTPLPSLERSAAETGREATRPILRHQDRDLYYREFGERLGIGSYAHQPLPVESEAILSPGEAIDQPSKLAFTPPDFEFTWAETCALFPEVRAAGVDEGFNGLFSFTPDSAPLIGELPGAEGVLFSVAVWVTHSLGVGKSVAELIVDGRSEIDLHEADIARFEPFVSTPAYTSRRSAQNFVEVYDILHPLQPMDDPRPLRVSPFWARERELGAVFLEATGYERPHWYEANAHLAEGLELHPRDPWSDRYWSPIAAAEHLHVREHAGIFDMTALKRIRVRGSGALAFLQGLTTNNLERPVGAVVYTLLLDAAGGILSDLTICRLGEEDFQIGANGNLDLALPTRRAPRDGTVWIDDITPGTCCLGLWGPRARDILARLADRDVGNAALGYFKALQLSVAEVPTTAMRLSYVGELGYELYTTADLGQRLWDVVSRAGAEDGLIAAGRAAFNGMRLEKGYRSWGADMTPEHNPFEAGLGFAVRLGAHDFVGRDALEALDPDDQPRRLVALRLTGEGDVAMGKEPVLVGGRYVGYVTSAGYGYTLGHGVAYAWLPSGSNEVGTEVEIQYFDRRLPAVVASEPLFDPKMARLRG